MSGTVSDTRAIGEPTFSSVERGRGGSCGIGAWGCAGAERSRGLRLWLSNEDDENDEREPLSHGVFRPPYRTTSVARLSPRMISTVGMGSATITGACPGLVTFFTRRTGFASPSSARCVRRARVDRVSERELNLAFGAGQREPLRLLRRHGHRHDGDLDRLAVFRVLFHARAGREHLDVAEHDLRRRVFGLRRRAGGRQHVDARAGQHVAGDADDLVDSHGNGALPRGDDRRQARARLLGGELGAQDRLVADDIHDEAAPDHFVGPGERAFRRLPLRELDDFYVVSLDLGAERQVPRGDHHGLRRRVDHRLRRLRVHEVVGRVGQAAPGRYREQ
jgi:hypothetical protein